MFDLPGVLLSGEEQVVNVAIFNQYLAVQLRTVIGPVLPLQLSSSHTFKCSKNHFKQPSSTLLPLSSVTPKIIQILN